MENTAGTRGRQYALMVGANIRRLRETRGWTQQQLADALDAAGYPHPRSVVAKTETGGRPVTLEDLAAYAEVLEVPPSSLAADGNDELARVFLGGRLKRTADALADAQAAVSELQRAYPPVP